MKRNRLKLVELSKDLQTFAVVMAMKTGFTRKEAEEALFYKVEAGMVVAYSETDLKDQPYTDEELKTALANATHTGCCAGGHTKAANNEGRAMEYKEEMEKRGLQVPERKELIATGVFNGFGSC